MSEMEEDPFVAEALEKGYVAVKINRDLCAVLVAMRPVRCVIGADQKVADMGFRDLLTIGVPQPWCGIELWPLKEVPEL